MSVEYTPFSSAGTSSIGATTKWRIRRIGNTGDCGGSRRLLAKGGASGNAPNPCASGLAGKRAIDRSRDGGMGGIAEEAPVRAQEMFEVQLEEPSEFALE